MPEIGLLDGNGNVVRKELPNNVHERTSYDALNRRRLQATTQGQNYLLTNEQFYDRSGNVRVIEERVAGDSTKDRRLLLEYDGASRLTWEKTKRWDGTSSPGQWVDNGATEYQYDTANNRTWKKAYPAGEFTTPNATWESTYNTLNQLETYVHQVGGVTQSTATYSYDAAGRRTQRTRGTEQINYYYNAYHQLGQIQRYNNGTIAERRLFGYDYRARRIFHQSGSGSINESITRVIFSGGTSIREYGSGGSGSGGSSYYQSGNDLYFSGYLPTSGPTSAEYIRGSDWGGGVGGLLYSLRPELGVDNPRYTHYDGRGDVVLQTDSTGQKTFEAAYEAFGTRTRESGSTPDKQRANTKEEETTFQLLNEGHRYRDLETGVWLTRDPAGFVDGPNLYAYVRQNPWTKFDPEGLWGFGESNGGVLDWIWNKGAQAVDVAAAGIRGTTIGYVEVVGTGQYPLHNYAQRRAEAWGQQIGRAIGGAQAFVETVAGTGAVLVGTGATALSGGGAAPVSVPLAVGGTIVAGHGANSLKNWMNLESVRDPGSGASKPDAKPIDDSRPQHGTPEHDATSFNEAKSMQDTPGNTDARFNQQLTNTQGESIPGLRPDAQVTRELPGGGKVKDVTEVRSPSQTPAEMNAKVDATKKALGNEAGTVKWINPTPGAKRN